MIRKLRTVQGLAPADRACLLRALRLLPAVQVSLRVFGARRTQAWLVRRNFRAQGPVASDEGRVRSVVRMVGVARRYHRHWSNCLSHALTLWALLRREGIAAEVRVGARLRRAKLEAHAWVEWQGEPLSDPGDGAGDFAAFNRPLVARPS